MGFALSEMSLKSPAFEDNGAIPKKHSGEGKNVSPPLTWEDVPKEAKSLALVVFDPDAPLVRKHAVGFTHWVL
ncbi:MAG: YbhB/YbcL family Raf kinase inhibitor-like protein, partial [Candidatus Izemoplasmataceae bacterium]